MDRRGLFGAIAVAALGLVAGAGDSGEPKLSRIWRRTAGGVERCRMYALRPGELFVMEGQGKILQATSEPRKAANGVWEIESTDDVDGDLPDGLRRLDA